MVFKGITRFESFDSEQLINFYAEAVRFKNIINLAKFL